MNNGRVSVVVGIFACVFGVLVSAATAAPVEYKLKLKKGQKYYTKTISQQNITQTLMGTKQDMQQSIGIGTDFDVIDVNSAGDTEVRMVYKWIQFSQKTPRGELVYDSSKSAPVPPAAAAFAALLNEQFTIVLTDEGKVSRVKGLEAMKKNINKKLPPRMATQMLQSLSKYLSEESIKEMTEVATAIYPDKPVKVGDSWSRKAVLTQGSPMVLDNTWTLKERANGIAKIEVSSVVKPDPKAEPVDTGMGKVKSELAGTQKGGLQISEKTGMVMLSKIVQNMSGNVTVTMGAGDRKQDMVIPMVIKGTTTVETTKKN